MKLIVSLAEQRLKWLRNILFVLMVAEVLLLVLDIPFWIDQVGTDAWHGNSEKSFLLLLFTVVTPLLSLGLTIFGILLVLSQKRLDEKTPQPPTRPNRFPAGNFTGASADQSHDLDSTGQTLAHRADELTTINRVAETINRTLDLQEIFNVSLRGAVGSIGWDMGSIHMWDEQSDTFTMVSYEGLSEDFIRQTIVVDAGDGLVGKAVSLGEILVIDDARSHPDTSEAYLPGFPVSQIYIPLISQPGQMVGVLNVSSSIPSKLRGNQADLLVTIAHQIAIAIDKAQLYSKVSHHAVELERIVDARTEQLEEVVDELQVALERAKEAETLKSLLLSTVSHELRTPLATIKGNTSMLREHHARVTPKMLVEHLKDIEEETDKLTDLISNLLDMSRLEAGILHIQPHPIDLVSIVRSAVNAGSVRYPGHEVSLSVTSSTPPCLGDARRIDQIVANLIDNAAKYSPPGSAISVQIESRNMDLVVSVKDQGLGIAPEKMERIFDRFYQISQSGDSGRHGIGLGLAICRGLVEAHGGGIWATSEPGTGSIFSFSIPMAQPEILSKEP